ncbi:hypothetical protein TREMEDRAFT_64768 [Tremella mesenterica DSM 1558]|uniref:uncharacterized protein n=1 Tax=Tremella mesenterica (strain ATCC 24925 / CBS 8224 / DSM 1558 / NBRC 9311 / NRRL Y-6157 / RJB 2259-6 / UBC 559-6) TaxID=578456 RepID=UPI0003F4A4D6|nr:uncharacterized protein TREMEDRAFT_64768 [Tremella mesenterica DSM 1558]EIW66914.1 hypothetical protein TREMEDRAFT_64768 [Tremella mesenterica DSM 1558]
MSKPVLIPLVPPVAPATPVPGAKPVDPLWEFIKNPPGLPNLPQIADEKIRTIAITEESYRASDPKAENYTKFALIGDAILDLVVLLLCHKTNPQQGNGGATVMKFRLTNQTIIGAISFLYGLPSRVLTNPPDLEKIKASERNAAEMFEAHIGGLFLDRLGATHSQGQAYEFVSEWLEALYEPLVQKAFETANAFALSSAAQLLVDNAPVHLDGLKNKRGDLTVEYKERQIVTPVEKGEKGKRPAFEVICDVVQKNGKTWSAVEVRPSKKDARTIAAYRVLQDIQRDLGIIPTPSPSPS